MALPFVETIDIPKEWVDTELDIVRQVLPRSYSKMPVVELVTAFFYTALEEYFNLKTHTDIEGEIPEELQFKKPDELTNEQFYQLYDLGYVAVVADGKCLGWRREHR